MSQNLLPVNKNDWAVLREQTRQSFPEQLEGQPLDGVLLPYQREVVQAIYDNEVVGIEKGRRTGLSWGIAAVAVLFSAASRKAGGMDVMYTGYEFDMTRGFIDDCAMWAKAFNEAASEVEDFIFKDRHKSGDKDIQAFRITFASGYHIVALSSRPRSIRSRQGLAILDEAAFQDDFDAMMDAALAMLIWGGKVVFVSTHFGANNPFNEIIKEIRAGKKPYKLITITFDRALEEGLFRRICLVRGKPWSPEIEAEWREKIIAFYGDGADEELFCIPSESEGAYLTTALIESCMHSDIPVFRWSPPATDFVDWEEEKAEAVTLEWCENYLKPYLLTLPPECSHYIGVDFARSVDLSVFLPATETITLDLMPPFLLELRDCPHRTQKQILFYICDRMPLFSGGSIDARGNGSYLAEAARQKYGPELIAEVMITEKWYREIMPKLKARFEDKTIWLPKDAFILADFRSLEKVRGVARIPDKRASDGKKGKRHGDAAIAGGMLIHARETFDHIEEWECETVDISRHIGGFNFSGF